MFEFFASAKLLIRAFGAAVVNVDEAAEANRVNARVKALSDLAQPHQVFWKDRSRTSVLVQFQDHVEQVHSFFWTCQDKLAMVYRTMFPLNPQPNTLAQLFEKFKNPAEVRRLVRSQLVAGAEIALAFVHDADPSLDLTLIVTRDGVDAAEAQKYVSDTAVIAVQRLEEGERMQLQSNRREQS